MLLLLLMAGLAYYLCCVNVIELQNDDDYCRQSMRPSAYSWVSLTLNRLMQSRECSHKLFLFSTLFSRPYSSSSRTVVMVVVRLSVCLSVRLSQMNYG